MFTNTVPKVVIKTMIPHNANNMAAQTGERVRASGEDKYVLQPTNGSVSASMEDTFKADLTNVTVSQHVA